MKTVRITAGTTSKENDTYLKWRPDGESDLAFKASKGAVILTGKTAGTAGTGFSEYPVTRTGSVDLPMGLLIEMVVEGLLNGSHSLSAIEEKRLLLAIAGAISVKEELK